MRRLAFVTLALFFAAAACFAQVPGVAPGVGLLARGGPTTTLNPLDKNAAITLSNGNLTATASTGYVAARATVSKSTGKWYFEVRVDAIGSGQYIGIGTAAASLSAFVGSDAYGYGKSYSPGYIYHSGSNAYNPGGGYTFATSDVIMIAVDFTSGSPTLSIGKNGSWDAGLSPGSGQYATGVSGAYFPMISLYNGTATIRCSGFSYTPPSGYLAWN